MDNRPIGIFDSGLGGLSVWRAVRELLPGESIIYFGDGANCPYGNKSREEIERLTLDGVGFLVEKGAKLVVVACNTATAAAIDAVRERFAQVPVVGVLPAVKPAAATTKTGVIAVLATESLLAGEGLKRYVEEFARGVEVIAAVGEGFVEIVEDGREDSDETFRKVREVVEPLIERGADKIVLGCTHYPFLRGIIEGAIGSRDVEVIDPSSAVARRVEQLLNENGLLAGAEHEAEYEFYTLGGDEYLEKIRGRVK